VQQSRRVCKPCGGRKSTNRSVSQRLDRRLHETLTLPNSDLSPMSSERLLRQSILLSHHPLQLFSSLCQGSRSLLTESLSMTLCSAASLSPDEQREQLLEDVRSVSNLNAFLFTANNKRDENAPRMVAKDTNIRKNVSTEQ
jgi:hypothetical protein